MAVSNPSGSSRAENNGSSNRAESYTQMDLLPPVDESPDAEDGESIFEDQDGAQAALQPAISSAASHLTSSLTPAAEKAAVLERIPGGGFFDGAALEPTAEEDAISLSGYIPSGDVTPRLNQGFAEDSHRPLNNPPNIPLSQAPEQLPVPSLSISHPKEEAATKGARSPQARPVFGSAFDMGVRRRSRSASQDALKRLQKAMPSLTMPTIPSLPTNFFSNLGSDSKQSPSSDTNQPGSRSTSPGFFQGNRTPTGQDHGTMAANSPLPEVASSARRGSRPAPLRRVTSDDSILYQSLSRASSLGHDDQFQDVREMVNIRLMAIKDSLPDVPNFKLPSFTKRQSSPRMPSMSFNNFFSGSADDVAPRNSPVNASSSTPKSTATTTFDRALEEMTGDIVILGGYRGSILRSAEPPHQQLWAPVKLGFNMRKANLEVGLEDEDEETMKERIIPSGMLTHIGPIDISRKLFKRLRSCQNARSGKLRVWDFGYDWRLSPALSSRKLVDYLSGLPSNQSGVPPECRGAIVIAHSLGGLITRHAVNQQPDLFAGVLYAGVPQRCINILGPFRNGDTVLFNEKLLTAQVNFSIRSSFVLLPDDGFCFVDKETGQEYPVDFLDPDEWVKWRLSPCVGQVKPAHIRDRQQVSSPLSSLFPNSLLKGARFDKRVAEAVDTTKAQGKTGHLVNFVPGTAHKDRTIAPQLNQDIHSSAASSPSSTPMSPSGPEREQYMSYLRRTLDATRKFRAELAHNPQHEASNAYPPHAVLYGKSIPTVYAAQVMGRDGIACVDAYDDLLFRAGDGVVLAREAMLPEGYALVRDGRASTERGHLTMLGDLPAVGQALEAIVRGRNKGIGLGPGRSRGSAVG
ncbi:hypothetical protein HIM_04462 [Hirsutella minnesotensis 3608]|uniref:Uncharacterized protein n=1 Tax=Hirsutella minnesotensis 3608 TaxID=1043627 RepID=A0A0F7ZL52_9HYPO|nr:hypothetical protein HIM_04462 [Hirsutella minnesotensis 3608]